ncbi:MAG TPA: DUF1420 family protein [Patescibacteria group bacterium]|nr:DUF1420 family protein [Patescibacteria group bacterium]
MAPLATLGVLLSVAAIFAVATSFGLRILAWSRIEAESPYETALFAAGLGFLALELVAFALASVAFLHRGQSLALLIAMALVAGNGWAMLARRVAAIWRSEAKPSVSPRWKLARAALWASGAFAMLTAMAPLTGSDALRYHFTTALAARGSRSPLRFDILHSFFTGEGHALIALGLALGSDRIALGLICAGGLLTMAVVFALASRLMPAAWAWVCAATFLLTPMVFWQISVSGAPDIWMSFFTALAVLALARAVRDDNSRWFVLAGLFAGAVGGAKYTGWFVAAAVVLICWVETRSARRMFLCGVCAFLAGFLPLLRNFGVGGDPFFPFLMQRLGRHTLAPYTFAAIVRDTRSSLFRLTFLRLLGFPFRVTLDGGQYGLGQLFGPLVLAFAPLLVFVPWRKPVARMAGFVWLLFFAVTALTTQMGRFLLPVYPLALALAVAGAFEASRRGWRVVRVACVATLAFFLLFSAGADLMYARDFLPVAVGLESRQAFLDKMAPDYQIAAFINGELGGRPGKAMVFFQHVYYLRVPFVAADPTDSRAAGELVGQGPGKLLDLLRRQNVRWVVKSPGFPPGLNDAARKLEEENILRPVASSEVTDFAGDRIYRRRENIRVVILQVEKNRTGRPK